MERKLILVTNDDGIAAPGIRSLVEVAKEHADVIVVAPDSPQSGKGHAVTLSTPLRLHKVEVFKDVEAYECTGTPVDCVKIAMDIVLKDRRPDLCISGTNHGSNASINILYSGTVSAAMEASVEGTTAIGFSLLDYSFDANFEPSKPYISSLIKDALDGKFGKGSLLNVNIPNLPAEEIKGIKFCRQSDARWEEEFVEAIDPRGQKYYWMTGKFVNRDKHDGTDIDALEAGYISVVPSMYDLTDYGMLEKLNNRKK